MGRCVKGYRQGEDRPEPYIPRAFGNRADKDPIKFWIRSPTEHDLRTIYSGPATKVKVKQDAGGAQSAEVETTAQSLFGWKELACSMQITKIENYEVRGRPILTGDDLARYGETELVTEAAVEITIEASLSDEEKKTSDAPSDSSPPETPASTGTATTAEKQSSATSAGADPEKSDKASSTSSSASESSTGAQRPGSETKEAPLKT